MNIEQNTPDASGKSGNEGVNSAPNPEVKTFTQEEVNQIVQSRLAKEKDKYKDYDSLKSQVAEYEKTKEQLSRLENEANNYNKLLEEVYESLILEVAEDKRTLIPEELSLADKIKYISKNKSILTHLPAPATPPREPNPKGEPGLIGGKYTSLLEFATKDPKSYYEARKAGKI